MNDNNNPKDNNAKYANNPPLPTLPAATAPNTKNTTPPPGVNGSAYITLASLDDGTTVKAQYNPKELQIDKNVPWSKVNQANQSQAAQGGQGIHLEFTGAEGRTMSIEMLFDGYETNTSIVPQVKALEWLTSVLQPDAQQEALRRPHRCVAVWGNDISFRCVINSLQTKYTMFSSSGTPLRATCTVKLMEADVVSISKGK
ncbi:MAG TPA: hypothetical protein VMJ10_03640 [Kofleriaceae bacterium]|nr:hypothetical protein [Kofleriaceae bacterium]